MSVLFQTASILILAINSANAHVLPRNSNGTANTVPDSTCTTSNGPSCESTFDRIPTFVKAIIFIGAFIALGALVGILHRFTTVFKNLLPSWMRSRSNALPPTQAELVMCWERYGPRDGTGMPRAGTQRELLRLWGQKGEALRFDLIAEPPRMGEGAPFIVPGARWADPEIAQPYDRAYGPGMGSR